MFEDGVIKNSPTIVAGENGAITLFEKSNIPNFNSSGCKIKIFEMKILGNYSFLFIK